MRAYWQSWIHAIAHGFAGPSQRYSNRLNLRRT
jgi:hypothetical protein